MADDTMERMEKTAPAQGFMLSLEEAEGVLAWPGCTNGDYYIHAKAPDFDGARKIERSQTGIRSGGNGATTGEVIFEIDRYGAFVAKCQAQITDFRFPVIEQRGATEIIKTFGMGRDNKAIYERLAVSQTKVPLAILAEGAVEFADGEKRDAVSLRDLIEGFLDQMAGIDTASAKDYETLKNAPRP